MINESTRTAIISNRFAYIPGEVVAVDAAQLCAELIAHEKSQREVCRLQRKVDLLRALLAEKEETPGLRYVDLRA